ncbi:hypothetical protein PLICRDRAFT_37654, partial [Plicaturopsis crispa FD-325 SS-3]
EEAKDDKGEVTVNEACWIYEQLRRLAQDLSHPLITMLQQECTRSSCPEMKAGEWLYLCVAHGNDGAMEQCCAIDYIMHTLDSATALLNSPRAFPSRLSIPQTSYRHFSSLARRLGRIFAHAYFHHREAFEQAEVESSLYARFLALTSKFDLVPAEFLVIPSRLTLSDGRNDADVSPPRLQAAAIDPLGERERRHSAQDAGVGEWAAAGSESPRKVGRNRTDTMVFSEAYSIAGELAKQDDSAPAEPAAIEDALGTSDTGAVIETSAPEAGPSSKFDADTENVSTIYGEPSPPPDTTELRPLPEPVAAESHPTPVEEPADAHAVEPSQDVDVPEAAPSVPPATENATESEAVESPPVVSKIESIAPLTGPITEDVVSAVNAVPVEDEQVPPPEPPVEIVETTVDTPGPEAIPAAVEKPAPFPTEAIVAFKSPSVDERLHPQTLKL